MLTGRVIAALCHGAFYGVATVVAAGLVAEHKKARAISFMFAGLTVAMVLGVPAGTFFGQLAGWRSTFWAIALIGALSTVGIALLVRSVGTAHAERATRLRDEFRIFARPQVLAAAAISLLVSGGEVGAFTYIAFTYTEVSGIAPSWMPWLLLFGVGTFLGNALGGKLADRSIDRTLMVFIPAAAVVMALFALSAHVAVLAVILTGLMGGLAFVNLPGMQLRTMSLASDAPTMASGANIAALNIGNALGVAIGGLVITTALGYTGPLWVGAGFTVLAFIVLLGSRRMRRDVSADTPVAEAETVAAR